MAYGEKKVSKRVKVLFPIVAGLICMLIAPMGAPLMGMLMLGNFLKESGVVGRLADVSSGALVNIVTLLLGICIGSAMLAGNFLQWQTILVFILGLVAISSGHGSRRPAGEADAGDYQGQGKPPDRCCRYLGISDVSPSGAERGAEGKPEEFPAVACHRRQYRRADWLGDGGISNAGHPGGNAHTPTLVKLSRRLFEPATIIVLL